MRARELLDENYQNNFNTDLTDLLTAAKASGVQEIATSDVVQQLSASGYSVNINSIMTILVNNPLVMEATPESIKLTSDNGDQAPAMAGGDQDSASKVSDMAQKANSLA